LAIIGYDMIRKLTIENYKSIEKTSLNFEEINVLIGKNGAGKTTLISVVNMLMKLANGANINALVNDVAPFGGEFYNANSSSRHARFELVVQTPSKELYDYSFSVAFGDKKRSTNELGPAFYIDNESLYKAKSEANPKKMIFQRTGEDTSIEIQSDDGIGKMPLNVDPRVLVLSSFAQNDAKLVAQALGSYSIIWMDSLQPVSEFEIVSSNTPNLGTIDGVAVSLYLKNQDLFNDAMNAIKSIIPGFTSPEITNINDSVSSRSKEGQERKKVTNYIVSWSDSHYSRSYGISRMSLSGGNNRVIYLILSLYNCEASSCFVAEEIENGMHLSRIAKLIDQMRMIVKNRKIQLFFTTHNHLILDDLLPKEIIFTRLGANGSVYTRLTETKEYTDVKNDLGRAPRSTELVNSGLLFG